MVVTPRLTDEHVIDLPIAFRETPELPVELTRELHTNLAAQCDFMQTRDIFNANTLQQGLDDQLTSLANRNDLARLDITQFPHLMLTAEALATPRVSERPEQVDVDRSPLLPEEYRVTSGPQSLREVELQPVAADEPAPLLADALRQVIYDTPNPPSDDQLSTVQELAKLYHQSENTRSTQRKSAPQVVHAALQQLYANRNGVTSRNTVLNDARVWLRRRRNIHLQESIGATIGLGILPVPAMLFSAWTLRLFAASGRMYEVHSSALAEQKNCFSAAVATCPIVPISSSSVGPERNCADAAAASCEEKYPVPDSNGAGYSAGGVATGLIALVTGGGALTALCETVPRIYDSGIAAMRENILLARMPKPASDLVAPSGESLINHE